MDVKKESRKHILVISQYFYPETFRINDICLELIKKGFKVTVLTGYPNYPKGKIYEGYKSYKFSQDSYEGINIIRIPIVSRGHNKIKLLLNYLSFVISGFLWQLVTNLNVDFVFIYEVSPMTQALPGIWFAKKKKIPCYIYVMDLWPENVQIAGNISNDKILNYVGKMVDYIYSNCTAILTSSKSFIHKIHERGISKDKLFFWPQYAEDYYYPMDVEKVTIKDIPNDKILNLTFAGNIGFAQGLEILPRVAYLLKKDKIKVRFNLIGDGRYKQELMKKIKSNEVEPYFNLIDSKPPEIIKEYLAISDGSLIILSDNELFEMTIPAKLQSSLACGVPIIGSISGETKEIIDSENIGYCSEAGDVIGLYNNIIEFNKLSSLQKEEMRLNSRKYYLKYYDKQILMEQLLELFNKRRQ